VSPATLDALLHRVGVMAMPSRQEGFGIVYLEAMKAGLSCIGATEDGASEPIVHGVTGLLVEQSDQRELAHSIISVLSQESLRNALGVAGLRRFESEFTFERYRARLLAALSTSFANCRPPGSSSLDT
jgi:glycosyltransferase involved in cell wall biosynthesis